MVRFKHRYLLIDILYPPSPTSFASTAKSKSKSKSTSIDTQTRTHLAIHHPTPDTLTPQALARAVRESVEEMYGDWGVGRLGGAGAGGLSVKYLSPATSTAILRCPRASYRLVWTALTYMSSLPLPRSKTPSNTTADIDAGVECLFRVVRVSGTMRKAEEEAIGRARREVVRMARGGVGVEGRFGGEVEVEDVDVDVDVDMVGEDGEGSEGDED
ncbi:hypothetical protein FQN50_002587 [Emmonsiellopsis sp. PD_5]|nr:hypothetical protein FQN50_002587 [Emmonsiellopsis sp. PD_5]